MVNPAASETPARVGSAASTTGSQSGGRRPQLDGLDLGGETAAGPVGNPGLAVWPADTA